MGFRPREPSPPEASHACLPVWPGRVQFRRALAVGTATRTPPRAGHPIAAPDRRPPSTAHPCPPAQRHHLRPARCRCRYRHHHRLPLYRRGDRNPGRPGPDRHGMNVQVLADPHGRLLWASPALPGAVHDVRAAREHGIIHALDEAKVACWADKAYQGASVAVRVPYRGRWDTLSAGQQAVNRSHAKVRALVEQAVATLKSWRPPRSSAARPPASPAWSRPSSACI